MAEHWLSTPSYGVIAAADVGREFTIGKSTDAVTLDAYNVLLGGDPDPGDDLVVRFGDDLDGTVNVDYVELTFSGGDFTKEGSPSIAIIANGAIKFRIESRTGTTANNLSGNVRIATTGPSFSAVGMYTTQTLVADFMGLGSLTAAEGDTIDEIILGVSAAFDSIINGTFVQRTLTEWHDGYAGRNGIVLHHTPSETQGDRDLATCSEDGTALTVNTQFKLDPAVGGGRTLWRLAGANDFAARFATGSRNIEVTYKTTLQIPNDIAIVCRVEVERLVKQSKLRDSDDWDRLGRTSRAPLSGSSVSYSPEDFGAFTMRVLDAYRRSGGR